MRIQKFVIHQTTLPVEVPIGPILCIGSIMKKSQRRIDSQKVLFCSPCVCHLLHFVHTSLPTHILFTTFSSPQIILCFDQHPPAPKQSQAILRVMQAGALLIACKYFNGYLLCLVACRASAVNSVDGAGTKTFHAALVFRLASPTLYFLWGKLIIYRYARACDCFASGCLNRRLDDQEKIHRCRVPEN